MSRHSTRRRRSASVEATRRHAFRPILSPLEERRLLSTFTVTNTLDDGSDGSLRWAIGRANSTPGADTIDFDATVFATPRTITLTGGELRLTDQATTTIAGPGQDLLSISGNDASGVFTIWFGADAELNNLTVTHGSSSEGGGIYNLSRLKLTDATVSNSTATDAGPARTHR